MLKNAAVISDLMVKGGKVLGYLGFGYVCFSGLKKVKITF